MMTTVMCSARAGCDGDTDPFRRRNRAGRWLVLALGLSMGCNATSMFVEVMVAEGQPAPKALFISLYDRFGPLKQSGGGDVLSLHFELAEPEAPRLGSLVFGVPSVDQTLRLVLSGGGASGLAA